MSILPSLNILSKSRYNVDLILVVYYISAGIHTLQPKQINKPERISFMTTYNPSLPSIFNIIKKTLQSTSNRCKNAFLHLPVVAFRRSLNLRDPLVTAKLSPNVTHSNSAPASGLFSLWQKLRYLSLHFPWTNQLHINSHITCETKNLIYMIQCNRCHLQYIGETKRRLKDRFNEHRRT